MSLIIIEDTFTRANNTDLGSWWDVQTGQTNAQIVSNRVRATTLNLDAVENYNPLAFSPNQGAEILIATIQGVVVAIAAATIRADPAANTYYYGTAVRNGGGGETTEIKKRVAGVSSVLATESATTWAAGDTLNLQVRGTSLVLLRNGTSLLTVTDTSIGFGRPGLILFVDISGNLADLEIESWQAEDFDTPVAYQEFPKPPIAQAAARGEM